MDNLSYRSRLMSLLTTREDVYALEEKLENLYTLIGKVNTTLEPKIKDILDYNTFNAFLEDFKNLRLQPNNQTDLENYIDFIKKKIEKINYLKLTLAITPSKELIDEIFYWINKNIGQDVVLDLTVDKRLIAGSIIEYGGRFKNYSIQAKLDAFWAKNPNLI